jgi:hypothetical protein
MPKQQLHKRLTLEQVTTILEHYLSKEISLANVLGNLGVKKVRFFQLLKQYQENPDTFTITPPKKTNQHRHIGEKVENLILAELKKEKALIENKATTIRTYNYSSVRDDIVKKHKVNISVPTIISRAREFGFYLSKPSKKVHDREVITNLAGELIQHDSSHHLWSPFMTVKLYLITSLDDYSRFLLYADLFETERAWAHISSIESTVLGYGCALKYYLDQHSIFRYVKDRDKVTPWYTARKFTDEATPQFKQVLQDCGIELIYALSPQAKGKVERPYRWLQDRIVRTCAKEGIKELKDVRKVLQDLVYQYNNKWVHSTTKEIPSVRLERAIREGKTLFRPFMIKPPYQSSKDIFALREKRVVNPYRKISIQNFELTVPGVPPRQAVDLRIVPHVKKDIAEVRMWFKNTLVSSQLVRHEDLRLDF